MLHLKQSLTMTQLINILLISIIIGMVTNAINIITQPGMIFGFIQSRIKAKIKEMENDKVNKINQMMFIKDAQNDTEIYREIADRKIEEYKFRLKPLWLCPTCMSSVWGTIVFCGINLTFNLFAYNYKIFGIWVLTIIVSSFASYLFSHLNHSGE